MSEKPAVLIHPPLRGFEKRLTDLCEPVHWPTERRDVTAAVAIGSVGIRKSILDAMPALKTICCFGVGIDGLDLDYCRARGIAVTHGRDINHEDVADLAMGLLISAARRMSEGERVLRGGAWKPPLAVAPARRLRGMKLGIVGLGAIGKAFAERAAPFGFELAWTGPRPKPESELRYEPDLRALAEWADALIVCARGDLVNLVDAEIIAALGERGYLINVSRGAVVDEDAVIAALKSGALGGAGLDVFREEPTPAERWANIPNVVLTPHLGGATRQALIESDLNVLENLRRFFAGEPLLTPVP